MMRVSRVTCTAVSLLCVVSLISCVTPAVCRQRSLERLMAVAASPYLEERDEATESQRRLVALGHGSVAFLIERLGTEDAYEQTVCMRILTEIGEESVPGLVRALEDADAPWRDEDPRIAPQAAIVLGRIGDPAASGPLLHTLDSEDWRLRSASVTALGQLDIPDAVGPLITALHDPDKYVRKSAAVALGKIGPAGAVPALTAALSDSFYGTRFAAADALAAIGRPASPAVLSLLGTEEPNLRCLALRVLGRTGSPEVLPDIVPLVQDEDGVVRGFAAEAVAQIGVGRYRPLLEEQLKVERHPFARMRLEEAVDRL